MERLKLLVLIILALILQGCASAVVEYPDGTRFRASTILRGPVSVDYKKADGTEVHYNGAGATLSEEDKRRLAFGLLGIPIDG